MTIHKEGYATLITSAVILVALNWTMDHYFPLDHFIRLAVLVPSLVLFLILLQFFRSPTRKIRRNDKQVLCPADGKVVVVEETDEKEILKDRRIQVSIFMSPFNVHVNRYPVSGQVVYLRYHPGKYLVAWHPKSSEDNERTTVVIENGSKVNILMRQIAGALARRIVYYPRLGYMVKQGEQMGFIKFGSRVDVFLPPDANILVSLGQRVRGGETILAELP
jgi:phosphatidylserine decarboxylase